MSMCLTLQTAHVVTPPPRRDAPRGDAALGAVDRLAAGGLTQGPQPRLLRNPFEFGRPPEEAPRRAAPAPVSATPAPTATDPPPLRLIGVVHHAEGLRAALSAEGEVVVMAPGGTVLGHRVLSVDEDQGVRLRTPQGEEILLRPAPRR
jgi:hypothetical protein